MLIGKIKKMALFNWLGKNMDGTLFWKKFKSAYVYAIIATT
jgi:hypothetical protein